MKSLIKQDINFLDKPLWFQDLKARDGAITWQDLEGYVYRTGYKLPDKVDMLFLFFMLMKVEQNGYQSTLELSRYEILKNCGYIVNKQYLTRLEDSLKRWVNVTIEFQGTFYDGKEYLSMAFHILDAYRVRKEDGRVEINFNAYWLNKIRESTFFKLLNFNYYKALKKPASRRLFEILVKSFQGRQQWEIDLVKLGTKLTLSPKREKTKQGEKSVLYPSIVLAAIKPAINEINKQASNPELLKEFGMKPSEAFTISYELKGKNSQNICFTKNPSLLIPLAEDQPEPVTKIPAYDLEFQKILKLLQKTSLTLEQTLLTAYQSKGSDFVRSNILYANKNAKRSYIAFLKKSLAADWGEEDRTAQLQAQAEEQKKQKRQAQLKEKLAAIAKATFVTLPNGEKHKIKNIRPDGGLMYEDQGLGTYLQPELVLKCRLD